MKKFFSKASVRFILLLAMAGIFIALGNYFSFDQAKIDKFFNKIPRVYWSVIFIALYVVSNFFIFWDIKDILKLIAAILFGAYTSTFLIYIAEIINAYLFFNISNILGKEFVEKSLSGKFKNLYEKLGHLRFSWVVLLRLIPLIPYRVLDISFGLSKIPFRTYLLAVILASLPRIFLIQFPLAAIKDFSSQKMMVYFQSHPFILWAYFAYFSISIVIAVKAKKKLQ
ncbi:MAG: VTT domain-containing protein [Candidatus Omnitrophota bacterium]